MKAGISFAIAVLFTFCSAAAQTGYTWFPVKPAVNYNYTADTSATISCVIKIDSSSFSDPSMFYLNRIVKFCDTCKNASLLNDFLDSTYFINAQPQFLGNYFKMLSPGQFYFRAKPSFVLHTNVPAGHTWLYDTLNNIHATVVSKPVKTILGISDSVEVIALSSNDTIIISRQAGLVRFPFRTIAKHSFSLTGTEGALNCGVKLKRFHDFFSFNAGDVFQYEMTSDDYNFFPPMFMHGAEKWEIQSVNNYADSVVCQIKRIYFDSTKYGNGTPVITTYTQTMNMSFVDSAAHLSNLYPEQEIMVSPYLLYQNGITYIHKVSVGLDPKNRATKQFGDNCPDLYLTPGHYGAGEKTSFQNTYIIRNKSKTVGRMITEGLGVTSELYNDYDRIYRKCLVGYIKGADTSGVFFWPAGADGIHELNADVGPAVFPNPARDQVSVLLGGERRSVALKVMNVTGQILIEKTFAAVSRFVLDLSDQPCGVYILEISSNGKVSRTKIIRN